MRIHTQRSTLFFTFQTAISTHFKPADNFRREPLIISGCFPLCKPVGVFFNALHHFIPAATALREGSGKYKLPYRESSARVPTFVAGAHHCRGGRNNPFHISRIDPDRITTQQELAPPLSNRIDPFSDAAGSNPGTSGEV